MKILVTGGLGIVGKPVVRRLAQNGHNVRVIDRQAGECTQGVECVACDVTDFTALREQMRGMEAIVHLAATPSPTGAPGHDLFRINCSGTFNVYEAAAQEGIQRIAVASSINWLGYYYGIQEAFIHYFPIDEDHPNFTTDPYSFSKQMTEEIAAYYWRREGITSVCLRMPAVFEFKDEWLPRRKAWVAQTHHAINALAERTPEQRASWLSQLLQKSEAWRAARWQEASFEDRQVKGWGLDNPDVRLTLSRNNFWALLDGRDAAQAFEKSLTADFEGCHALFVNDSTNSTGLDSELLLDFFFPQAIARTRPLVGAEALVSIEKARKLIGFEPEYSFAKALE